MPRCIFEEKLGSYVYLYLWVMVFNVLSSEVWCLIAVENPDFLQGQAICIERSNFSFHYFLFVFTSPLPPSFPSLFFFCLLIQHFLYYCKKLYAGNIIRNIFITWNRKVVVGSCLFYHFFHMALVILPCKIRSTIYILCLTLTCNKGNRNQSSVAMLWLTIGSF